MCINNNYWKKNQASSGRQSVIPLTCHQWSWVHPVCGLFCIDHMQYHPKKYQRFWYLEAYSIIWQSIYHKTEDPIWQTATNYSSTPIFPLLPKNLILKQQLLYVAPSQSARIYQNGLVIILLLLTRLTILILLLKLFSARWVCFELWSIEEIHVHKMITVSSIKRLTVSTCLGQGFDTFFGVLLCNILFLPFLLGC